MIVEQDNDRLTFPKEEQGSAIGTWLMLLIGISVGVLSYSMGGPLLLTFGAAFWVFIILIISISTIFNPRSFTLDRKAGMLTIKHQIQVIEWKIEWKEVYPLQDIKDVTFMTIESNNYPTVSYYTELYIRNYPKYPNTYYIKKKTVQLPGNWGDLDGTRNDAEIVASFLGLTLNEGKKFVVSD